MALTFGSSELLALFLESILYGMYFVMFVDCIRVLYNKRRRKAGGNHRLLAVSCSLFVLITWHEILDCYRVYRAYGDNQTDQGADSYFIQVTAALSVMKTSIYVAETVVSDLFILYRCYIVWNANIAIVAFPALLFVADIGTGIAATYTLTLIGTNVVFNRKQERITNSFFSCTLALNAVCTGLIAFRIWWTQKQTRDAKMGSNLTQVSVIVIESGAIYLTVLACVVALYNTGSLAFNIFLDITSPIIGIVFSLIIVRIGRGISSEESRPPQTISYSMPSKLSAGNTSRSNGPIVFRTTTTTQFTDTVHERESTIKDTEAKTEMYKMELRGDGDSSISG